MPRYDRPDVPFYFDEVIGGSTSYHRTTCHIIQKIYSRNYKRFRGYEEAQAAGLSPCRNCRPPFDPKLARPLYEPRMDQLDQDTEADVELDESRTADASPVAITDREIARMRTSIVGWVRQLDDQALTADVKLGKLIGDLTYCGRIPRQVSGFMRAILELRNVCEYQSHQPTDSELKAAAACFEVLEQWAAENGLEP